jgi:hypothetical protein
MRFIALATSATSRGPASGARASRSPPAEPPGGGAERVDRPRQRACEQPGDAHADDGDDGGDRADRDPAAVDARVDRRNRLGQAHGADDAAAVEHRIGDHEQAAAEVGARPDQAHTAAGERGPDLRPAGRGEVDRGRTRLRRVGQQPAPGVGDDDARVGLAAVHRHRPAHAGGRAPGLRRAAERGRDHLGL